MANVVAPAAATAPPSDRASNVQSVVISVDGMTCQSCVNTIETQLSTKPGVETVSVSLRDKQAIIMYDVSKTNTKELVDYINDLGFESEFRDSVVIPMDSNKAHCDWAQNTISIDGMTCRSCVANIEAAVGDMAGVTNITVSLAEKQGHVTYNAAQISIDDVIKCITELGFTCGLMQTNDKPSTMASWTVGKLQQVSLHVQGMRTDTELEQVRALLANSPGVVAVKVTLLNQSADVLYNPIHVNPERICNIVKGADFTAHLQGTFICNLDKTFKHMECF